MAGIDFILAGIELNAVLYQQSEPVPNTYNESITVGSHVTRSHGASRGVPRSEGARDCRTKAMVKARSAWQCIVDRAHAADSRVMVIVIRAWCHGGDLTATRTAAAAALPIAIAPLAVGMAPLAVRGGYGSAGAQWSESGGTGGGGETSAGFCFCFCFCCFCLSCCFCFCFCFC